MEYAEIQGESVPKIGLGTWNMRGQECYRATLSALELGYRHIDTAEMYENESEVGRAIADSGVSRSELFLVTKVSASHLSQSGVLQAAEGSLQRLNIDVIDLYLVHWPSDRIPIEETMAGMNELVDSGKVRRIGVSNFSLRQLEQAEAASSARIFTNQIEYFIGQPQEPMLQYCQKNGVLLTAYSPLDRGRLSQNQALEATADAHGVTVAQVALRWLIQQENVVAIPKSTHPDRQRENLDVFGFELSSEQTAWLGSAYR
ncbi:MAG: aldo/keto reductase [Anaerolineae bacterium]|nr:MAG: aldo/keto reductase [Anaerolineae bacterium]